MTSETLNLRAAARNMNGFDNNAANFYGFRCAKDVD
jgi:formylglycine-generating enzyme required for sulfatase activity